MPQVTQLVTGRARIQAHCVSRSMLLPVHHYLLLKPKDRLLRGHNSAEVLMKAQLRDPC